ncbi:uncharacterized protein LOC114741412 [Neltuma alba]|uniref:uncharacterized protein LOC114741412 n=1 Tax=Neltuma alba TaxID=207710 RepID=UPI0010A2D939|nr:uncharacterized protein LOC114741412 [Prosopis alba]
MASYSLPSLFSANGRRSPLFLPNKSPKTLRLIKVHTFQDEGRSTRKDNNIVDKNLDVLKERMEMVKVKERLESCCRCEIGWNYYRHQNEEQHDDVIMNSHRRNKTLISDLIQIMGLVCGTVGSTCLSGTLLLCLLSLVVHFHSILSFH